MPRDRDIRYATPILGRRRDHDEDTPPNSVVFRQHRETLDDDDDDLESFLFFYIFFPRVLLSQSKIDKTTTDRTRMTHGRMLLVFALRQILCKRNVVESTENAVALNRYRRRSVEWSV